MDIPPEEAKKLFHDGIRVSLSFGIKSSDAEDISIEALNRIRQRYDPETGDAKPYFLSWVRGLSFNLFKKYARDRDLCERYRKHIAHPSFKSSKPVDYVVAIKQECESLLSCLPPKDRKIVEMYFLKGHSSVEIAAKYNLTHARVCQIIHEALEHMAWKVKRRRKFPWLESLLSNTKS